MHFNSPPSLTAQVHPDRKRKQPFTSFFLYKTSVVADFTKCEKHNYDISLIAKYMITNKQELKFYLKADGMMNRGCFLRTTGATLKELIAPDYIMRFLVAMRYVSYYQIKTEEL